MRVEILTLQAGPHGVRHPGEVCDVSKDEGKALVAGGFGRETDRSIPSQRETAAKPAPAETADQPPAAKKKGAR